MVLRSDIDMFIVEQHEYTNIAFANLNTCFTDGPAVAF